MDDGTGHLIRLHSIIGMGAYGTVFKAYRLPKEHGDKEEMWRTKAQAVAVKQTIFTEVVDDITVVLKEVSYLSNLQHPNIVSYYTAFTNHGRPSAAPPPPPPSKGIQGEVEKAALNFAEVPSLCIVEELVEGASVAKVLRMIASGQIDKPMTEAEVAVVLYDVLQALLYIHEECRLVHRDIKPLNMLLSRATASVKLCDFGTCADMSQQAGRYTVIGTIGWIAPEVLDSGMMDYRSGHVTSHSFPTDIWSLGVSALEMARPTARKTAFSEYIKDLSASPCSVEPTVNASRKSFLNEKLPTGRLRDFIACCLRKDPQIRPTVRQLLQHPLIVGNGVSNVKERRARITAVLTAVRAASKESAVAEEKMADDGIVLPQYSTSPTLSKNRCMEAIAAIKRDFFAAQAPLPEKSRTSHYAWRLPSHLARMSSSEDCRYMPTPLRPQGLGQVPVTPMSAASARTAMSLKPLFDSVVLPATAESQRAVLGIMRKYRRLAGAHTVGGWTDIDQRNDACYTLDELASQNLKRERFVQLHDELLRAFKAACMSIPDFGIDFLSTFVQSVTSSDDDAHDLQRFIAYLHQLQEEDLMHTHRGQLELNDSKVVPTRGPSVALPTTRSLTFATAEDWLRFPRMPQSAIPMSTSHVGGEDSNTDAMRQQAPLVIPSAYLFNKWLKGKQADAFGAS
ncbi:protein kinase [Trypanosoma grayi]|uniref:protein kinase n=1 Tax=Trypanosoma grayi TaxID=71804 RepID=UPI0004F48F17|nr:protein kinase [Trypanosoma grayi]KEG15203.1 protein kinase [Trypanosoma grayi]